ncbi:TPA: GNAT family N-acetyltransferase [Klebsiella pneumoniae]|nr:GNAT family N-acetyltransferase [Klebsiella pneumoniae]HBR1372228.1 GNAT family N-acetyltransferase [Klebsiella pneumoniae]
MYTITDIAPTDAEFIALIAALDAWQETLYPAESNHLLDLSQLPPQTVIALAIRSPQGEAVGCGAIVLSEEGFGEMKRVYIDPQHRGQQLGEKLLAALEAKARQRDCHTLRLETGIHQHAAIALYTRNGYQSRCAFAPYQPDPLSVFMEKSLFADLRSAAL